MTHPDPADVVSLFDELIQLERTARQDRLDVLARERPDVCRDVESLLAAGDRAGDFLQLLRSRSVDGAADAPGRPLGDGASADGASGTPVLARRYQTLRIVGRGAMGEVWLAADRQLGREVALKWLPPWASSDAGAAARFLAEARAAAQLDHPHVATVYDVGEVDGRFYITMAYYPGGTLRDRLAAGALPAADALRIAAELADALAAAHARGIVHRDVKPANVLFDVAGRTRLADFGVAKLPGHEATAPGAVLGTLAYMAPEQARGERVDARADLWSLGVVLYEMLAGRRPFDGAGGAAVLDAVLRGAPAALDPALPAGVRALVTELLARSPDDRPRDAAAVRDRLHRLDRERLTGTRSGTGPVVDSLPVATTSFVGRERELDAAADLLAGVRLLTLTGPGGTGKTRFALELAGRVRARFPDGVCFVALAPLTAPELVPAGVAQALGMRDLGGAALDERVLAHLRALHALLVLDNFEHVLDAAPFVARLLAACPHVSVVVTSRAPLRVQGEQELAIPPLTTPDRDDAAPTDSEAVRLFVQRTRSVRADFAATEQHAAAIAEICRRLDGLPLAIELAAARAKIFSPPAILARLGQRLDFLRRDSRDGPARHRTLREVMDWSYALLTAEERALFGRLSIFAGGIAVEAAEAVAPHDGRTTSALDLLASLCDKNLLRSAERADGEPRFQMLETVREYGREQLRAAGDEEAARRAHRAWCVALVERAGMELRGPAQTGWFDRLDVEYPNFRVALDGALAEPATLHDGARLAAGLVRVWLTRGPLVEGIDFLDRITACCETPTGAAVPPALRAELLRGMGLLMLTRSAFPTARDCFERTLAIARELNDRPLTAAALANLGWAQWCVGDVRTGEAHSAEALALYGALGDRLGEALAHHNLGWAKMYRGDLRDADTEMAAAAAIHERRCDLRSIAFLRSSLGVLRTWQGRWADAVSLQESATALLATAPDRGMVALFPTRLAAARHESRVAGDHVGALEREVLPELRRERRYWLLGYALSRLGVMLRDEGALDRARAVLDESLTERRLTGSRSAIAESVFLLGDVARLAGEEYRAASLLADALRERLLLGEWMTVPETIEAAALLCRAHDPALAARLLAAVARVRRATGLLRSPRQQLVLGDAGAEEDEPPGGDAASPRETGALALVALDAITGRRT